MKPHFSGIRLITAAETYALRQRILRPEAPMSDCEYLGDDGEGTVHFAMFNSTEIVGVASLYEESTPDFEQEHGWRIRGMATDASVRSFGCGKKLLQACLTHAQEQGGDVVWCNARTSAKGFYKKQGFKVVSTEFKISGIGAHYLMAKMF